MRILVSALVLSLALVACNSGPSGSASATDTDDDRDGEVVAEVGTSDDPGEAADDTEDDGTDPDTMPPDDADPTDAETGTDSAHMDASADAPLDSSSDVDADTHSPVDHAVVFVGNSYTAYNGLSDGYRDAARVAGGDRFTSVSARAVTPGGYRLTQHASDAADPSSSLGTWLASGAEALPLTHLVLQEQSQIPGFPTGQPDYEASLDGAVALAARADALGAQTVLYMTWGRRDGDTGNPDMYPDYLTMQTRLEAGYRAMAARIADAGYDVEIAPVGLAFREVHRVVEGGGAAPATPGTAFYDLYAGDGSHPSAEGTWLVLQVMLGVVADLRLPAIPLVPAGVTGDRATLLRDAAWAAIEAERARD